MNPLNCPKIDDLATLRVYTPDQDSMAKGFPPPQSSKTPERLSREERLAAVVIAALLMLSGFTAYFAQQRVVTRMTNQTQLTTQQLIQTMSWQQF
ncbi:MAG: hypothetical protein AAGF01_22510 [Cyanobacteria bacterium P01_G01_bin.38]